MTPHQSTAQTPHTGPPATTRATAADFLATAPNPGFLEIWAHAAPIRLAGYEDDLAEPHILQGID